MIKTNYILVFLFCLNLNFIQAQDEKDSKFHIVSYGGIGYGILDNDNQPNYNMNSNSGDILLNYDLNNKFGIATGIGLNELSGNGFNTIGNFYHERTLLKVPLLLTLNSYLSEKLSVFANFGLFGQAIIKDE